MESLNVNDIFVPAASLATNNPSMHKRAFVSQAIGDVRFTVRKVFSEYLKARRFTQFESPYLLTTAPEGGANVFEVSYLAQSPQFYKQHEIAGGRKKVYCIGPAFRTENSNTTRHMTMTEVC
jgi:aspartyl-tRNA synthetase